MEKYQVLYMNALKTDLSAADIIVSAGRGIQKPQNLELIRELANCLGATVGSSRALVDAGWMEPHQNRLILVLYVKTCDVLKNLLYNKL